MQRFYLVDKPIGMTSFFALKVLKKKLDFPRLGHSGTLDPLASGALLIAVWNYTKLLPFLEDTSKEYVFEVTLWSTSPSHDMGTPVTSLTPDILKTHSHISQAHIEEILKQHFTWDIQQVPPKYSAIRVDGQKSLAKMREGQEFELKARKVTIHRIEILSYDFPKLELKATVSAGTYVRSIAADLGDMLWCGGMVTALRRTKIANLSVDAAQNLDDFDGSKILDDTLFFPPQSIIQVSEKDFERLSFWLEISTPLSLENTATYFVKNGDAISHVVSHKNKRLKPLRMI